MPGGGPLIDWDALAPRIEHPARTVEAGAMAEVARQLVMAAIEKPYFFTSR